ncbi:glycosyltransferase [Neorhizobium lilium]|uniref:Glycosyltransferase n=1 Tax=Neorhizobium lilium TaxID=2503024 RepID=A0A3S3SBK7_9HYPH|nr:glycosyltransferase [Neorhizobium lilium]
MHEALSRRPELVLWLIAAYYVIAVAVRILRSDGVQTDESEQLFLSQFLLLGYGRQPPFYNWLQYGFVHLLGPSIAALSILKNGLLFLCCLFYGMAARLIVKDRALPYAAMLGVLALPSVSVLAQRDLTHAVATMWAVSFFLYAFLLALTRPSLGAYLLTGIAVGLGTISKYNFVVVPVAAILAILPEAELRRRLFDWRILPALAIAAIICLPHALWVIQNLQAATVGTINSMRNDATGDPLFDRLNGLVMLVASTLDSLVPLLAFALIGFRRDLLKSWPASSMWTRVIGRAFLLCILLVGLIGIGLGATTISQKWLSPFVMLLPLYLCLKLDAAGADTRRGTARFALPVFILAFGFILYLVVGNIVSPSLGRTAKENLPAADAVRQALAEPGHTEPAFVIAGDLAMAAGARLAAPQARVVLPSFPEGPLPDPASWARTGLAIWRSDAATTALPEDLKIFLDAQGGKSAALDIRTLEVPYPYSGGQMKARFGYAWIDGH